MGKTMTLSDFYRYVRENRKRIEDVYREVEEIQYQFNDLHSRQLEQRQKLIATYAPQLTTGSPSDLPAELRQLLETRTALERQKLQEEIAKLLTEIAEKRQKTDGLIQEAQRQTAYLREQNPILNEQEEELKARRSSMEKELQQLEAELKRAGWLAFSKRRRLRQQRERLKENLRSVQTGINAVRQKWQEKKKRLQDTQADLQKSWQAASVEVSQLQARLDNWMTNLDELCASSAATGLLQDMEQVPTIEGPWQERLSPLVELTRNKARYEAGLTSVAETLGLLKGLGEGMDRFIRSVATLYEEQRRYKLPQLTISLPDSVIYFHALWPEFQAQVKDEKYLGTHPLEFERRVKQILQERLHATAIQQMFEEMGAALNKATKAWR